MKNKFMRISFFFLSLTLVILFIAPLYCLSSSGLPSVSAECSVLIEADGGKIIFQKNADKRRPMASTTKIMTALIALEHCNLDKIVTVSKDAVGIEGSSIYLIPEERLTIEQLLYALMLESANDAAAAIAIDIAGSIEGFAAMMNEKVKQLGLTDTNFTNPHGLYDEQHYTTAYELAIITAEALKYPKFKEIVSTGKKTIPLQKTGGVRLLINHNKLLRIYSDAIGVKTGFTKKSGRCLVSAAERDGVQLIACTLNAPNDWNDHIAMLNYGFNRLEYVSLAEPGEHSFTIPVVGGTLSLIECTNTKSYGLTVERNNNNVTHEIDLRRFYFAPIKKGEILGRIIYYNNGEKIAEIPLVAAFDVPVKPPQKNFWQRLFPFIKH
ncbi:MAG: D-alanyl-D-alanine carboxypeptidase [Clostridiales bacterium]|nr:D-alanyl-D-alanine carboxypeptidase [Clostridiales bacterium]